MTATSPETKDSGIREGDMGQVPSQCQAPDYDSVDPMSPGQFKAMFGAINGCIPSSGPSGYVQWIIGSGAFTKAIKEASETAFRQWVQAQCRLRLAGPARDMPATKGGKLENWFKCNFDTVARRSDLIRMMNTPPRFLSLDRTFKPGDAGKAWLYQTDGGNQPDVKRIIACLGGMKNLRTALLNPIQVLESVAVGIWPQTYHGVCPDQYVFVGVCHSKTEFVFMRIKYLRSGGDAETAVHNWYIEEEVLTEDYQFKPRDVIALGRSIW